METKLISLDAKADEKGVIEGYGSVFGVKDLGGDIVLPGAFAESLKSGLKPKMLADHDPAKVIGVWDEIEEDEEGLRVRGRLALKTQRGRDEYELIQMGAKTGLSIGYRTVDADHKDGARQIKAVKLYEISSVTFAMNEEAAVTAVKNFASGNTALFKRFLEENLREAGLSISEAKAAAAAAANKLETMREAGPGLDELRAALTARAKF